MQHILIVDDELAIAGVVRERLEREGFGVQTVSSGEDALAAFAAHTIDLVLLDVGLPGIDGFEVLRRVRESGHDTPVILLTARGD
ncbi:MAG: response regulator, partial [Oscillochloris sp.]|nr:response regulator [Oscillochloris sp.]